MLRQNDSVEDLLAEVPVLWFTFFVFVLLRKN